MARDITRAELQEAIEAGISAGDVSTPYLRPDEIEALRIVGRTATKVARGTYSVRGCGCPATQADIVPAATEPPDSLAWRAVSTFTEGFDDATRRANDYECVLVVD